MRNTAPSASFSTLAIADPRCELGAGLVLLGAMWMWDEGSSWVVLGMILAGVALMIVGCRSAFVASRAARVGRDAIAQVSVVRTSWPGCVHYVLRDHNGHHIQGRRYMSREDARAWKKGDTGTVRYDPDHSSHNVWLAETREDALLEAIGKDRDQLSAADKLELARGYIETCHREDAQQFLDEVLRDGT